MPDDPIAGLLDESASLWHVVHSIERHVNQKLATHTYSGATEEFFGYIRDLALGTKDVLSSNAREATSSDVRRARLEVATLRKYWLLLHELIQPAGEAHSLSAPATLIELAADQLRQIQGLHESKVVVSLSPRLMYHQTTHTRLSALGQKLELSIPSARFPRQLGFVALPYSQGPSFFANLLLYHELGHFVFEELSIAGSHVTLADLDDRLIAAVDDAIAGRSFGPEVRAFALGILRSWTHEIFCDLFALCLIGPAFSFAFIELLGLLDFLDPPITVVFNPSHPAPACRFRQHFDILQSSGWWDHLAHLRAPMKELIERLAKNPEGDYRLQLDGRVPGKDEVLIPAFLKILPDIRKCVIAITQPVLAAPNGFALHRSELEKCLMNGIVPSVFMGKGGETASPVSVINSSFSFYLSSLETLMTQLGKDPRDIEARSELKHKLEQWTQKALEDIQLLKHRDKVRTDGRSIKD